MAMADASDPLLGFLSCYVPVIVGQDPDGGSMSRVRRWHNPADEFEEYPKRQ
jgi:hypothetical protein